MITKLLKSIPEFSSKFRPNVLVVNSDIPRIGLNILELRCNVKYVEGWPRPHRKKILQAVRGIDGLLWASHEKLNREVFEEAGSQLKVISMFFSGHDALDVEEVLRRNIPVGYTRLANRDPVADVAVGLMITAGRRLYEGFCKIKSPDWIERPQWLLSSDIAGSTVGIIGLGAIGQKIIQRLQGFEVGKFLYSGPSPKPEGKQLNAIFVSLEELLRKSDYVVISCPWNSNTKNLINTETLALMKPSSVLINVGRGMIVDHDALLEALTSKKIFAAGLDVTHPEPLPSDHPLVNLNNCFISPHLGSATHGSRNEMSVIASLNLLQGLAGSPMLCPISDTEA
ncbi:hypothetical protein DMENIID0001_075300 [Sergentomyia squamirostris]